ncbi:MAG: hypothetical protein F6K39_02505 [Okeania sp. SIO3B3]|nr:hypothetical protein [Okeania sp. SIO3B3]
MNTYTLEEVRQRELEAGGRRKEKVLISCSVEYLHSGGRKAAGAGGSGS